MQHVLSLLLELELLLHLVHARGKCFALDDAESEEAVQLEARIAELDQQLVAVLRSEFKVHIVQGESRFKSIVGRGL